MAKGRVAPNGARQLLGLVATMAATGVATYLFFILTARGQRFDLVAFEGRKATDLGVRRSLTAVMRWITIPGVVAGCAVMALTSVRHGRYRVGTAAVASVGVAVALAEVLKWVLPRPYLTQTASTSLHNTFPSGHSTAVVALVLSWIWVAARCERRPGALWCLAGLVTWLTAMLGSGWHRPSDVLGGVALATVVVTTARLGSGMLDWTTVSESPSSRRVVGAGFVVVAAAGLFVMSIMNPTSDPRHSLGAHLVVVVACNGFAALAFTLSLLETGDSRSRPTGS